MPSPLFSSGGRRTEEEFSSDYYFLFFLPEEEQYYLLHESFNLNSSSLPEDGGQRIVNFRVNQGNRIYLYDLKGKTLYYSSKSLSQIQGDLGIHPHTCKICIKGNNYLNFFKITDIPVVGANQANLSLVELASLISEKKALFLSNASRAKFSKPVTIKAVETG